MSILDKYLKKLGVESFEGLNHEEKETLKQWELALSGRKITDEDTKLFLETELNTAIDRLTDVDLKPEDRVFRKVEVRFIRKVIQFLNMPALEKKLLEKQIESKL